VAEQDTTYALRYAIAVKLFSRMRFSVRHNSNGLPYPAKSDVYSERPQVYKSPMRTPREICVETEAIAMRKRFIATATTLVSLLIFSVSLLAHHGNAEFDIGKRVTVKGTVTKWSWSNPHCFLTFDSKTDNGSLTHWVVETQPPRSVTANGFGQYTFRPGDEVTVTLEPVKNGQPLGRMLEVVLPNGKKLVTGHLD
jgi:hypothetical protein